MPTLRLEKLQPGQTITLTPIVDDARVARCGDRRNCLYAHTTDRTYELDGRGYVRVDANEVGFTKDGTRYRFHPARLAMRNLRRFDEVGAAEGEEAAQAWAIRYALRPIKLKFLGSGPATPPSDARRKAQVNLARRKREAARRRAGLPAAKKVKRYTGV